MKVFSNLKVSFRLQCYLVSYVTLSALHRWKRDRSMHTFIRTLYASILEWYSLTRVLVDIKISRFLFHIDNIIKAQTKGLFFNFASLGIYGDSNSLFFIYR